MQNKLVLPDIEKVCAAQHDAWIAAKKAAGIHSKVDTEGEEMMRPYHELHDKGKEVVRGIVNSVYNAIEHVENENAQHMGAPQQQAAASTL